MLGRNSVKSVLTMKSESSIISILRCRVTLACGAIMDHHNVQSVQLLANFIFSLYFLIPVLSNATSLGRLWVVFRCLYCLQYALCVSHFLNTLSSLWGLEIPTEYLLEDKSPTKCVLDSIAGLLFLNILVYALRFSVPPQL